MSSQFSDPNWWPKPPPVKVPSTAKIVFGTIVPVVVAAGLVIALLTAPHGSPPAKTTAVRAALAGPESAAEAEASRRVAFAQCLKGMGAGSSSGFGRRGRFGRTGPSQSFRDAFDVCRSLLQSGGLDPSPPAPTRTSTTLPVA